jgi:ribosomal protein S18 acetylase RimI-like enzyme
VTTYVSRGYTPADLPYFIELARHEIAHRHERPYYYHPGDDVWGLYAYGETEDIRVWFEGDQFVGWAALELPVRVAVNQRGGVDTRPDLADEMLAWAEGRTREAWAGTTVEDLAIAYRMLPANALSVEARDSDAGRIAFLQQRGYALNERGSYRFEVSLDRPIPEPELPSGFRLRYPTDADIEERAELHRDAWSVWGASTFSAEKYRALRTAPLYEAELDVVVEAPDGHLVSYCICWADPVTGVGYFEPVGTRPAYTGKGLGREMIREGLRRLKAWGMHTATVSTASVNHGAAALYRSAGFEFVEMEHMYTKALTP